MGGLLPHVQRVFPPPAPATMLLAGFVSAVFWASALGVRFHIQEL
jgi:hypothetical protein